MDLGLKGKVAIVTGAGGQRGYGKGIAMTLAKEGCDIVVVDKDLKGAKLTAAEIEALGRKALAVKTDVTNNSEVQDMVKAALDKFGKIDILVNNAGGASQSKPFTEKPETEWQFDINLNLYGVLNCTKAVIGHMVGRKSGKIVNIASGAGRTGLLNNSSYSAAKGGVIAFTRTLAREVAPAKINVNCIAPGIGDTDFIKSSQSPPESLAAAVAIIPLGRSTTPRDIANAVAFLVSEGADYIEGQTLSVNGGVSMF
jgi:2-hydroxycyclohexanecarboxyl-CoA dehydrogenase